MYYGMLQMALISDNTGDFILTEDGNFEFSPEEPVATCNVPSNVLPNDVLPSDTSDLESVAPKMSVIPTCKSSTASCNRLTTRFKQKERGLPPHRPLYQPTYQPAYQLAYQSAYQPKVSDSIKLQAAQINLRPADSQTPDHGSKGTLQPPSNGKQQRKAVLANDDVSALIQNLQKRWNKHDVIPQISKRLGTTNEMVRRHEILRARLDTGDTVEYAAEKMGVRGGWASTQARAIVRQELNMDPGGPDPFAGKRRQLREMFIEEAYALVLDFIKALHDPKKIEAASLKDIATSLGIVMDKVLIASGKFEETKIMEFSSIKQMNDETLGDFIRETEGAIQFLTKRSGSAVSLGKPETGT